MPYERPPLTREQLKALMIKDAEKESKRSGKIPTEILPKHYKQNVEINRKAAEDEHPEYQK